ncbi:hypothetical protein HDU84_002513 [Entophlyctis sp. JEL0112]|nr:hypothetical protein HDU84_002513 [Entophlyctis sp. JEL0112]
MLKADILSDHSDSDSENKSISQELARPSTAPVRRSISSFDEKSRPKSSFPDLARLAQPKVVVREPPPRTEKQIVSSSLPPPAPGNAHKRYTSVYPCANKLLAKRWDDAAKRKHQKKLATMKTYIDANAPKVQGHLKLRTKKLLVEDQKLTRIDHENHILLARMVRQMSTVQGFSGLDSNYKLKFTAAMPTPSARKKREWLEQIDENNQTLMRRIEAIPANYCQELWNEERRTNLAYLQRITRFPEGYQKVLDRERVPPPIKAQLRIRFNRVEILRKKWSKQTDSGHDEIKKPTSNPNKSDSSDSDNHEQDDHPVNVYLTKSEKIRRAYIKTVSEGGEKEWRKTHAIYTNDPLDLNCAIDLQSHERTRPKLGAKKSHEMEVRLNRTLQLRLFEQEERKKVREASKVPEHLANIEARIDFGKGTSKVEKNISLERDRDILCNNTRIDESEYETILSKQQIEMEDSRIANWHQVFCGFSFRSGFVLPEGYPRAIGILWCSEEEDSRLERWEVVSKVVPKIKEKAARFGIEIFLRDLNWGVPKSLSDLQNFCDLESEQLEKYMMESLGIHFITLISHKRGTPAVLPSKISIQLYENFVETFDRLGDENAKSNLQRWYKLNENFVPPAFCLVDISANIEDFASNIRTRAFRTAKEQWMREKSQLLRDLSKAVEVAKCTDKWIDDDSDTINMLSASRMELMAHRAVQGPTEDAILILRNFEWKCEKSPKNVGGYVDWTGDASDETAASKLTELRSKLQTRIRESNIIVDEVEFYPGIGMRFQDADVKRYVSNLTASVNDLLESSLGKVTERLSFDSMNEEVLFHSKAFSAAIGSFAVKIRTVNKVCTFFQTRYRFGIPPLVVYSPNGEVATALVCKGLQKYMNETMPLKPESSASGFSPIIAIRFVGTSPNSCSTVQLLKSLCKQIKRATCANDICSSPVADSDAVPTNLSSLSGCFIECLKTATSERPLFIILLGLHRLQSDDAGYFLSWIPMENSLPHVHFVFSLAKPPSTTSDFNYSEFVKVKADSSKAILSAMKHEIFNDLSITIEAIDIPHAHVELTKWLRLDGINLSQSQRRNILVAATGPVSGSGLTTTSSILRRHYLLAKRLRSWEEYIPPSSTAIENIEKDVIEAFFFNAEKLHGREIISRLSLLLVLIKDGLSETCLEDLLSIDRDVLAESIASQIETSAMTTATPLIPIPRISSVSFVFLLKTIITDYELVIRVRGFERGPYLLKWSDDTVCEVARAKYANDPKVIQSAMEDISSYYSNDWTDPEKKGKTTQPGVSIYLKSIGAHGENWKGIMKPHKLLMKHEVSWQSDDGVIYDIGRLRILPRSLVCSQRFRNLRQLFEDFNFVEALFETMGPSELIKELSNLIKEGRKQSPQMPSDCAVVLKHLILFFRCRLIWMDHYGQTKALKPSGLLLQEFNNLPQATNAQFYDEIHNYLDDNLDSLSTSHAGRLEFDNNWKESVDKTDSIPFYHIQVQCIAVSADGKIIASGSADGTVKIWNTSTGEEIFSFTHIVSNESALNVSPAREDPNCIKPENMGITFLCFSPDRQTTSILTCCHSLNQEPSMKLWNLKAMHIPAKVLSGGHSVGSAILRCEYLLPENRRLLSAGSDFSIVLWEMARCRIIRVIQVPTYEFDFGFNSSNGISPKHGQSSLEKGRKCKSGYPQISAAVSSTGLFAYGSTTLIVTDPHWKDVLVRDVNIQIDKDKTLKWHRITSIGFSPDSSCVFVASAVAPDDVQLLIVERQQYAEKLAHTEAVESFTHLKQSKPNFRQSKSRFLSAINVNAAVVKSELDIKRAKQSVIRSWNIETGQLKLAFSVDDYLSSISISNNGLFIYAAGNKGTISGFCAVKGTLEFVREGHAGSVYQLVNLPTIVKKRKDDDDSLFYTYAPFPGLAAVTGITFNVSNELCITIGGGDINQTNKVCTLIRIWDVSSGDINYSFDIAAEVIFAQFAPSEFWVDYESVKVDSMLGNQPDWPFGITGTSVIAYALHPEGKYLAAAVSGNEREPSLAITIANCKVDHLRDIENINAGSPAKRTRRFSKLESDISVDRVLKDIVKIVFWDVESGNSVPLATSFNFPIFFEASDNSLCIGPYRARPYIYRKSSFKLDWSTDGKVLFASDSCEIFKECAVTLKENRAHANVQNSKRWKLIHAPPTIVHGVQQVVGEKIDESAPNFNLSSATAFNSVTYRRCEYFCFAFGDGVIGLRVSDLDRGRDETFWFLGHTIGGKEGGEVVGCAYVPTVEGRSNNHLVQKQSKLTGVIVSARRNGTVLLQDACTQEICAVFGSGVPLSSMAVVSSPKSIVLKIAICKSDGTLAVLRYES